MNKTIATYKAYLKALHTRVKASIRSYVSTIDRRPPISAIFSITSGSLAVNELPGRSIFTLSVMAGPSVYGWA